MFNIIPPDTDIDFVGTQTQFAFVSGFLILASFVGVATIGPTYGIDFKGGSELIIKFDKSLTTAEVGDLFSKAGVTAAQVQRYGSKSDHEFLVQTEEVSVVAGKRDEDVDEGDISAQQVVEKIKGVSGVQEWNWTEENPNRLDLTFANESDIDEEGIVSAVEQLPLSDVEFKKRAAAGPKQYVVEFQGLQSSIESQLYDVAPDTFNPNDDGGSTIKRMETVGPRVGEQLRNSGILSIIVALFCILVYVAFRFDLRYAPGAVAALTHDVIIAVGFFTFTGLEITLPIIAALLTIVGYSLNDTIVVFDRIRENIEAAIDTPIDEVSNTSINETLSRTLITSLTTLLAVVAIAVLATGLIQNFAIALIVGVVVGTYSSVYVATPVMLKMDEFLNEWRAAREAADEVDQPV